MFLKRSSTTLFSLLLMSSVGFNHNACAEEPLAANDTVVQEKDTLETRDNVSSQQEQAREREQEISEDPLAQREIDKVDKPEELKREKDLLLNGYASLRYRYRRYEGESIFGDSDTRVGGGISWRFKETWRVFANGEVGISLLDEADALLNQKGETGEKGFGDTIYRRLLYVGIETPRTTWSFGKNWSSYYQVAFFTDRFQGTGGSASGTYNAGTDGGPTGTGRADQVLQTRLLLPRVTKVLDSKPLNVNVQAQYGRPIPQVEDRNYGVALGLSAQFVTKKDFAAGLAYNFANISNHNDPDFRAAGIDGDAHALLFGVKWFNDDWYIGSTLSRLLNHETTDEDIYFDGTGWEVYAQRKLLARWYLIGGGNWLRPDSDQKQAGEYEIKYGVLGIRYTFDDFRRMIYANTQFSGGSTASGEQASNVFTIGVRWDFP
jgi:hypothetical protein